MPALSASTQSQYNARCPLQWPYHHECASVTSLGVFFWAGLAHLLAASSVIEQGELWQKRDKQIPNEVGKWEGESGWNVCGKKRGEVERKKEKEKQTEGSITPMPSLTHHCHA